MNKVGICLGGKECGKPVVDGIDEIPNDYRCIDLKFTKEVIQHGKTVKYVLKLTKMVLNINENNTVDFDISGGIDNAVCIGSGYLAKMKDLAREIVGDDYVC